MDDLSGLNWSSSASQPNNKPPPMNPSGANYFGSMRQANSTPSPFPSGRNTPLSAQGSGSVAAKPPAAKPAADSFSNLLSFGAAGAAKPTSKLTLLEQQQRLEAEKKKKEEERRKQAQAQFGGGFLDTLGSGSVSRTTSPGILSPGSSTGKKASDDDDLFAAFNSETKVDNASFYPPPPQKSPSPANAPGLDLSNPSAWSQFPNPANNGAFGDDDDPFGLNQLKPKAASPAPPQPTNDDDDFLGDLARPVEEVRRKQPTPPQPQRSEPGKPIEASDSSSEDERPTSRGEMAEFDRAVAQLVDYGFTPENARRGLTESGAGLNVQAAANWLLDDAHRQAKAKAQGKSPAAAQRRGREDGSRHDSQRRADTRSPAGGDPDLSKTAAAVGNSLFKTANSLWKTGKKQVQQAVADFNQPEGDPNQPKWMRSAQLDRAQPERRVAEATDEAMMLESGGRPPRKAGQSSQSPRPDAPRRTASPRDHSLVVSAPSSGRGTPVPRWQQQGGPAVPDSKTRASKLAMTDDSAASYVSPHRRKKATPQPEAPPPQQDEPDLLFGSQAPKQPQSLPQRPAQPSQPSRPAQPPVRRSSPPAPKPASRPVRQIPPITPAAIQQSTKHRLDGTAQFKRGDYGAAHSSYSSSLAAVPLSHPLAIVILTNRALTALKTGEPKQAVEDADAALKIIGPAGGQGEQVTVVGDNGGEERREMRDLYGKALSRKAEALEQMERWGDAHAVWSTCVKNGVGGPTAISGRQRCQSALAPKPKPKPRPAATRPRPAAAPAKSSEAVERLRKQNQAAAQEDDEKFALSEKVDAKIAAWRDGKRDNLRALIGSLDQVLWEGSGWKKVGLHELVMANKVKIHYMKAIAKCHPDKLPQDASTEVRLIAATVFATLNESWDKFKAENGL
ncbi:uba ts-n domain-containing protein [Colletotrichum incanum]|uniref:Uba ts-n domain-containing protein n=1 Tax=Colletotrichum incanum TaxID=1573173 RepID=A0A162PUT4_COLIC|nr:uba ts-n domain-containing protein [Colletotrichum incanum]OHW98163.1 uba ts-n domain-containing protein [Colletotrichum incanum]